MPSPRRACRSKCDLKGWLGDLEAFRTLCVSPPAEMKVLMEGSGALERTVA